MGLSPLFLALTLLYRYGRLNLAGTVLSKRKIMDLISNGHVHDWDDPRLYTLIALRRRGIPPGAILSFVNGLGVSKATTAIDIKRFEQSVRQYLERTVPRLMVVTDPIPIVIENLPEDHLEMVEVPFSKDPDFGVCTPPTISRFIAHMFRLTLSRSPERSILTDLTSRRLPAKISFG